MSTPNYCDNCQHPHKHGYGGPEGPCSMPLGPTGLPLTRHETQRGTCGCTNYVCEAERTQEPVRLDVDVFIENIAGGTCDPYLEAILAAAHGRKRALRNVTRPYGRSNC